jgi:hypothetical protein
MGMMVKYYKEKTSVAGSASFNTDDLRGKCERVFILPPNSQVTYDVKFTDDNGLDVYLNTGIRGTLNDISGLPLKGIYTVYITNISVDGLFKTQIEYEERM